MDTFEYPGQPAADETESESNGSSNGHAYNSSSSSSSSSGAAKEVLAPGEACSPLIANGAAKWVSHQAQVSYTLSVTLCLSLQHRSVILCGILASIQHW
jgi:hypothetical protein